MVPGQVGSMPPLLRELLHSEYAFAVLLGVFVLEGAMLMYFMPSEAIVPASIVLIGNTDRLASPENLAIITIAVVGATAGQYALFKVAERGGREYLLEKRWFRISEDRLERFDAWFERWGPIVIPVSNALLFTRGMLTVPAGFSELDGWKFAGLSALGTLAFEVALAALAFGIIDVAGL